jgi:hypothetical protein
MLFTWLIVTAFGSTMLLWNRSFVQLWVGSGYYAGTLANLLMILVVVQFVFIRNDANIIDLTLDLRTKVLTGLLSAGVSAAISAALIARFKLGIVGLTLGFLAGQSLLSVVYPLLVGRFLGLSPASQLRGVLRPACVTALVSALLAWLGHRVLVAAWPALLVSGGMTLLLVSLVVVYAGTTREQKAGLVRRLRRVLPGGPKTAAQGGAGPLP